MSTNKFLTDLSSELVLSDEEEESIKTSIATLQTHLQNWKHYSSVKWHGYFGSYDRDTILPRRIDPASDVDYMIEFDDANRTKPQTYLNWLKEFANTYYNRSEIHQDFPTIALELNHIRFELVPAVSPWGNNGLQIPAPQSMMYLNWISTNPDQLKQDELSSNKNWGYKLKPIIRLMKYWNVRRGKFMQSYALEQYLTHLVYYGCNTLEDYFFHAAENIYMNGISLANQIKMSALRSTVKKIRQSKRNGNETWAEYLIQNLF